jgi:hypothetical protein
MIGQLMKRDPAWRSVPVVTAASGAFCILWHFLPISANRSSGLIFISVFAALPFTAAYVAATQQGDTRFEAALPVTVRQVYLARVLAMIGLLWLPAAVSAAVALAIPSPAVPIATLVEFISGLTLVMVGMQSAGIKGFTIPRGLMNASGFLWIFGASIAGVITPIWDLVSGEKTIGLILVPPICWLASAAIFLRTWHTLPESFQTAPLKASPVAISGGTASSRWIPTIPWIPVMRTVLRWGGLEILYLFVLMLSGALRPYLFVFFAASWQSARPRVRWLFALPVRPRVLLSVTLLPVALTLAGGYLVSVHLPPFPTAYARGISVRATQGLPQWSNARQNQDCRTLNVLPSLEFWLPVKGGKAPLIKAPWGETFQPPVFHKSGFDIYDPYAVDCGNSERFLDWQFNRAAVAVYGRPIPRKKDECCYTGDFHVVTSPRTQFVALAAMTGLGLVSLIVTLVNDWHRFRRLARPVRVTIMCLAWATAVAVMLLDAWDKFVLTQWMSWTLPPSLSGAIAVTVPLLAILWWVLDILFGQVELVDKPEPSTA